MMKEIQYVHGLCDLVDAVSKMEKLVQLEEEKKKSS